jgi:RimJ/RimL family protein N-acetyltransferase
MIRILEARDEDFDTLLEDGAPPGYDVAEGGIEAPDVIQMLKGLAASIRLHFSPAAWFIVENTTIVGMCSLLAAPSASGSLAIGYGVAPTYRRQGIATGGISGLVKWAENHPAIRRITAETSVNNRPSQRVLERNQFLRTGERCDPEDGDLICWTRNVDQ